MRQAMRVGREMRGNPVEDHAEARRVGAIDEARKPRRIAEAARRREQADRLVAPGGVERMLADRQQFEMREAEIDGIGDQRVGEFVIGEERAVLAAPPRAEMDLVDRHRLAPRLALARAVQIFLVGPPKSSVKATTEAVEGRISASKPNGSAFNGCNSPSAEMISYL